MSESLGPRSAKRKALDVFEEGVKKSEHAAKKRIVAKKLRKDVDDLADMFGQMTSSDEPVPLDVQMEGQARRRRRRHTRKHKKSKKTRKHRK